MKYLLILLILFSTQVYSNSPEGKGLICAYGKNKDIYEAYLFFNKKYISKFLFLENYKFRIKQNEKRSYSITNDFINLLPFKIHKKNLLVIDTEFNRIIGNCQIVSTHNKTMELMYQLKNMYQNKVDKKLGIVSI
tara:strand:+ start:770 stop:1174 length:405 start_codon:yes stop_codon:yes gene_type:complete